MKFTYYGHSAFSIHTKGKTLIFDPFISPNELAKSIDVKTLKADYVLLSHGHGDHIADAVEICKNNNATVVGVYEVVSWIQNNGVEKGHPMNTGGKWKFDFGTVKLTSAVHSSSFPDGSYAGNPVGFVVSNGEGEIWYSGDTALTMDMKIVGEQHKLKAAILPVGDNFTMGLDDALIAAQWAGAKTVIGVHFDTFGYIKIDHEAAVRQFAAAGIKLILPAIGESFEI